MKLIIRICIYLIGLFGIALGTVLTTRCGLGVAAVTCLANTISILSSISLGTVLAFLYSSFVIIQYVMLRKEFGIKNLLQILFAFIFGSFTNFIGDNLPIFPIILIEQVATLVIGLIILAIGVVLVINMDIVPNAPDGLVQVISNRIDKKFGNVKVYFDSIMVLTSLILSFSLLGNEAGFGISTVVSALCLGRLINMFNSLLSKTITNFIQ